MKKYAVTLASVLMASVALFYWTPLVGFSQTNLPRKIEFKITAQEPVGKTVVEEIAVCVKEQSSSTAVSAAGWTNGCKTVRGNQLNETMPLPDTLKAVLVATIQLKLRSTIAPSFVFTTRPMDFTDPKSPLHLSAVVSRTYNFVQLQITSLERLPSGIDQPAPSAVELTANTSTGATILLARILPAAFTSAGELKDEVYLPLDRNATDFVPTLAINGRLRKSATLDFLTKQMLITNATRGSETLRLVYHDPVAAVRPVLRQILIDAGLTAAQAEQTVNVAVSTATTPVRSGARWVHTTGFSPVIELDRNFNLTYQEHGDSLLHEWTHQLFYVLRWQAAISDPLHPAIRYPANSQPLAWDEGMMHVIGSHLLNRALRQRGINIITYSNGKEWLDDDSDQNRALVVQWNGKPNPLPGYAHLRLDQAGNWIEAIPAGLFLEWYGQEFYRGLGIADPQTNALPMLRQIFTDLRAYFSAQPDAASWTLERFFLHLRTTLPPEMQRRVDQHLLWYLVADRATIARLGPIDRLVPAVLTNAMPAGAMPKVGDTVSVKVSARAIRRLVGEYRNFGGHSLKARLYEGATQLGSDINLGGGAPHTGFDVAAIFQPVFTTNGAHRLRAEIWGDFIDGTMEKLGEAPELVIDIGAAAADLSTQAKNKYQWLKDGRAYLQELLELDERTFSALEKAVHREILKRAAEGRYPPLTEADRKRIEQLENELPKSQLVQERVKDPLTGEEVFAFVEKGKKPSTSDLQKGIELAKLKARTSTELAITHFELECIGGETELHVKRTRELKQKIALLEESTPYKNFQEYAGLNDFSGYLKAVETLNKQLNLPAPIPRPVTLPWTYSAPCASVSAPASTALTVALNVNPNPVKPNTNAGIAAMVTGGKPPYKYVWTGDAKGQGATATFAAVKGGEYPISVQVTDADGRSAQGDARIRVSALQVKLELIPAAPQIAFGSSRTVRAAVTSDGQAVPSGFIYRWENRADIKFAEEESRTDQTRATFLEPGKHTLWVSVLTEANGVYSTVAESEPLEILVAAPPLTIAFEPTAPLIGQETKARLVLPATLAKDALDFRWQWSDKARLIGQTTDSRELTFLPLSDAVLNFTVIAREPVVGTELGRTTATLKARPFAVNAVVLGATTKATPDITLANKPGAIAMHQEVAVRASITPQPAKLPVKFVWAVTPDSANEIVGANVGTEIIVTRGALGLCEIVVEAFDANNVWLGKAATSFNVTIATSEIQAAKNRKLAQEKLAEAKLIIRKGKLPEAIKLLEEAVALDPGNTEAAVLLQKTKAELATIHTQLEKCRGLLRESRFREAQAELMVAQNINSYYPSVEAAMIEFRDAWMKYEAAVKEKLGAMEVANDNRQFHKTLELARQTRAELKLYEFNLENFNRLEQWARTHEAEKERQRVILKRGEEKLRNYDFAGAYEDFNVSHAKGDFYEHWNTNYDPEVARYDKLRSETYLKMQRIAELLKNIRNVANDPRLGAIIVEKAIRDCDEVLTMQPPNTEAQQLRATLAARLRTGTVAAEVDALIKQGTDLNTQKKYAEAAVLFTKAIALSPTNAEAWRMRGVAKREQNDNAGAAADFTRAIELDPQNHRAFFGRGFAREKSKDVRGAMEDYSRAIQLKPDYENALFNRAYLRAQQKDHTGAMTDYDQLLVLNPKHIDATNNRGASKENLGDLNGALRDYERALELKPDFETARKNLERVNAKLAAANVSSKDVSQERAVLNLFGCEWNWNDPRADASYTTVGDSLTITARNGNDLWYQYNVDAPRLVNRVTGNFVLQVFVRGEFRNNYNGAGLLVYAGSDAVIRFERGNQGADGGQRVWILGYQNQRELGRLHIPYTANDVYLKLERSGNQFTGYFSSNGTTWTKVGTLTVAFPATVEAGLALVNQHNNNVFRATFSNLELRRATDSLPPAADVTIFTNNNIDGVGNHPTQPTTFTLRQPHRITAIQNYHWNNGRGAAGGTIALRAADGRRYGPWPVTTAPGQGGVPHAYWNCTPNVVLPPGVYTVIDSDPATWAQNNQAGNSGITIIKGVRINENSPRSPAARIPPRDF